MKYSRGIPENQFFVVYMEIFNLSARDLQVMPVRSIFTDLLYYDSHYYLSIY